MVKFFSISTTVIFVIVATVRLQLSAPSDTVLAVEVKEENLQEERVDKIEKRKLSSLILSESTVEKAKSKKGLTLQEHIDSLMQAALLAKTNQEFTKSIELYNQIIALLEKSRNPEELKIYAEAHFLKAFILEFNLWDKETAIKTYENLISNFANCDDVDLIQLRTKAQLYEASILNHADSLTLYNAIIEQFKNSDDPVLLKNYVSAQFSKSYALTKEDAIAVYDEMIQKLAPYENKELREYLYQSQLNKANVFEHALNDKQAAIEVYDEIIERLRSYEVEEYQAKIDSALFSKSFLLMAEHREAEAMAIFDGIIENYQENSTQEVSKNVEYAIVNNIELALISGNDDRHYQELAHTYLPDTTEAKAQVEMLEIIKNAQEINQDEALEAWKTQYQEFYFQNWNFEQLETWSSEMEEGESQARIKKYLNAFENHNNYVVYQDPYQEHPTKE